MQIFCLAYHYRQHPPVRKTPSTPCKSKSCLPVTADQMRAETQNDRVKVLFNRRMAERHYPRTETVEEISIENGILLWGLRLIIPLKYRPKSWKNVILLKALSRIHVWFPKIDNRIEEEVLSAHKSHRILSRHMFINGIGQPTRSIGST